jgi:O-acetyl-ADP-ribose deacetylase (regulator of RNase III)
MEKAVSGGVLELRQGDITKVRAGAIVNAANEGLRGGGGVDGAIHRAGGSAIMEECRKIGHCPTGKAVITTGGELPAEFVIHAVGPIWHGGDRDEESLLRSAYRESLRLADENGVESLAFPSISTGAYGYPVEKASRIALSAAKSHLESAKRPGRIIFVLFSDSDYKAYEDALDEI